MPANIVILGGGFGGLTAAKALRGVSAEVTLVDRSNHHLFQPLLYQIATAGLSPADIAVPIRAIFRGNPEIEVILGDVTGVDTAKKQVLLHERGLPYDYLVVATGARHSYFGHPEWEKYSPGLKSIADAVRIRKKILSAFELAEIEPNPETQKKLLTFVIVGGGPTGVELAGAIVELAHYTLAQDFRHIDPKFTRVILIEAGPRVLSSFPPALSAAATRKLENFSVEVMTGKRVELVGPAGVVVSGTKLEAATVIWAAGVTASPAGRWLDAEVDPNGRIKVGPDLTVPGLPDVFVIGDTAAALQDGKPLPGVAPVAIQQGSYVADCIRRRIGGQAAPPPFRYHDKGNLATVGRTFAVAQIKRLELSGFIAWVTWIVVHIYYLITFRNRIVVLFEWAWAYVTFQKGARLIVNAPEE